MGDEELPKLGYFSHLASRNCRPTAIYCKRFLL